MINSQQIDNIMGNDILNINYEIIHCSQHSKGYLYCMALNKDETQLIIGFEGCIKIIDISQKENPQEKQVIKVECKDVITNICMFSNCFAYCLDDEIQIYRENNVWSLAEIIKANCPNNRIIKFNTYENELVVLNCQGIINVAEYNNNHWNWVQEINSSTYTDISLNDTELISVDQNLMTIWIKNKKWRKKQNILIDSTIKRVCFLGNSLIVFGWYRSSTHYLHRFKKEDLYAIKEVIEIEAFGNYSKFLNNFNCQLVQNTKLLISSFRSTILIIQQTENGNLGFLRNGNPADIDGVYTNDMKFFFGMDWKNELRISKQT